MCACVCVCVGRQGTPRAQVGHMLKESSDIFLRWWLRPACVRDECANVHAMSASVRACARVSSHLVRVRVCVSARVRACIFTVGTALLC